MEFKPSNSSAQKEKRAYKSIRISKGDTKEKKEDKHK